MNFLYAIGVVLTILAGGAGMVGYFRANVSKATIELYKDDNEALRLRVTTLEAQVAQDAQSIKALKDAQAFLTGVVTQADAIAALRQTVDKIATKVGA